MLGGKRVLVVGASSGIGRAIGVAAAESGARVALAARRTGLLEKAAAEIGERAFSLPCDVRDPSACEGVVADAVAGLGGLDALVYAAGVSPLSMLAQSGADVWRTVLETNVVGAALVTRAAVPRLVAARGRAVYISSVGAERPWPGLVAYAASKSALDRMIEGWRTEHPEVCFTRVVPGSTLTDFGREWDPRLAAEMMKRWQAEGYLPALATMAPTQVAAEVVRALASPLRVQDVRLAP